MPAPDNNHDDFDRLYGPSEADIERSNRAVERRRRPRSPGSLVWKLVAGVVFLLLVGSMFMNVLQPLFSRSGTAETRPNRTPATVTQVIDPRTITVEVDGIEHTVRYIGLDTPLFGDPYYDVGIAANNSWLLGKQVELEADAQDADREGRLLRYVWLDQAMVNLNLIAVGLSRWDDSGQNGRYSQVFKEAEDIARSQEIGIWAPLDPEQAAGSIDQPASSTAGPA